MSGSWIAKPLGSLGTEERAMYRALYRPDFPLSQSLEWGHAFSAPDRHPFVVFSPERKAASLFAVSRDGTEAECVNGPVLDWERIRDPRGLNEQISMSVFALHQAKPGLRSVRLRPRLGLPEFEFLREHLAFPLDRVDYARTMVLDLADSVDGQWRSLPSRIRSEIKRSHRHGVRVELVSDVEAIDDFWAKTRAFYHSRGLPIPDRDWIHGLLSGRGERGIESDVITAFHEKSGSEASLLLLRFGGVGIYFFAHESRGLECPNLSLNVSAQWEAMKACMGSGLRHYDLNGILPPKHGEGGVDPYQGVDFYKRRFKGREVEYCNPLIRFEAT